MKKVLSLVLALSLVLGTFAFTPVFAASFDDVAGENCEDAVNVLTDLGVVNGYEDGSYKPENIVTRAEMAVLVVNALGLENYVTSTAKSSFTDMSGYGWAEGYIAYAQSLGVISGYGDGTFRPGNTVSYDEAATMLVAALGYTPDALQGTWPANYVTQAKALGILDGIKSGSEGANRGDIAIMLYQTLDQAIGKVDKDGNWSGIGISFDKEGKVKEYDTMLSRLGASMYEASSWVDEDDDSFILTDAIADDAVANVREYVGAVVSAYANDDNEIIAIKEVFSTFLTGTYDSGDAVFTTTVDDVDYDVVTSKISTTIGAFFYNGTEGGASAPGYKNSVSGLNADTEYTLAVDLSGKKINEVYSIMYWDIANDTQVDADDIADIEADHKFLGVNFPETDEDEIDLNAFELVGVASLEDIQADDVVYVYKNLNDEIGRIAVGQKAVTGEVSKVSKDTYDVTIEGTVYNYSFKELENNGINDANEVVLKVEDEVEAYLDAYGYIYDYDKTAGSADKYAVVLKTGESTGIDSDLQLKLFLADGTTTTFTVDDDDIDGSIITNAAWVGDWVTSGNAFANAGMLIKYGVNKDGEIDAIESIGTEPTMFTEVNAAKAVTAKGYWDGREVKSDAIVFTYDGTTAAAQKMDGDNYSVTTKDKVLDSDKVTGWYALDNNRIAAMLLDGYSSSNDVYGILTDWSSTTGDLYDFVMYVDGKEVTYSADFEPKAANTAEPYVKLLKFNSSGEVNGLEELTGGVATNSTQASVNTSGSGIEYKLSGSTFTITASGGGITMTKTLDSSAAVYMLDGEDWSIERKSELNNLENGDTVYFFNTDDDDYDVTTIVVIKKA